MSRFVPFRLPDNLLLGCSTAATQIEGGDTNNSWYAWAKLPGKIKDGASPFRGNDHWQRMDEDIAYYWTFMDNFEWAEGESAPFGLVRCDFATQKRTVRPSGQFFSAVIRNRQVTQEMME